MLCLQKHKYPRIVFTKLDFHISLEPKITVVKWHLAEPWLHGTQLCIITGRPSLKSGSKIQFHLGQPDFLCYQIKVVSYWDIRISKLIFIGSTVPDEWRMNSRIDFFPANREPRPQISKDWDDTSQTFLNSHLHPTLPFSICDLYEKNTLPLWKTSI